MFRPQVFSTSRRLAPLCRLRVYSIPQPRSGFSRSGASLSAQPSSLIERRFPHAVGLPFASHPKMVPRSVALDFEALLRTKQRPAGPVVSPALGRSPRRVRPPPGRRSRSTRWFPTAIRSWNQPIRPSTQLPLRKRNFYRATRRNPFSYSVFPASSWVTRSLS
jgi:hypothetical protein